MIYFGGGEENVPLILRCNQVHHKLKVIDYRSGDDRDHWHLRCNYCNTDLYYHMSDEVFLNYCPICSNHDELLGLPDLLHSEYSLCKEDLSIYRQIENQRSKLSDDFFNSYCEYGENSVQHKDAWEKLQRFDKDNLKEHNRLSKLMKFKTKPVYGTECKMIGCFDASSTPEYIKTS